MVRFLRENVERRLQQLDIKSIYRRVYILTSDKSVERGIKTLNYLITTNLADGRKPNESLSLYEDNGNKN